MAKVTLPTDSEKPLKQESVVQVPESSETAPVLDKSSEALLTPETTQEQPVIESESFGETEESQADKSPKKDAPKAAKKTVSVTARVKTDRLEEEIEDILEEDLTELYLAMPPDKREEFRAKGEEIRSKIREIVGMAKVNAKKIFSLIRSWLKMIPGVNRFFLEQEAKIKTDKILVVTEEEKKRNNQM